MFGDIDNHGFYIFALNKDFFTSKLRADVLTIWVRPEYRNTSKSIRLYFKMIKEAKAKGAQSIVYSVPVASDNVFSWSYHYGNPSDFIFKRSLQMGVETIVGAAITAAAALVSSNQQAKAQKAAASAQASAQKQANDIQERAQSMAEQQNNRANANKVNANAIMGAIDSGYSGNLTGPGGISKDKLTLGSASTLGSSSVFKSKSTLGTKTALGGKQHERVF